MSETWSKDPRTNRALEHSVRDGVAFSVMSGAGESYFSAFALHLRASASEVGILATLPGLLGAFAQLLSLALSRRGVSRRGIVIAGAALQTVAWIPLVILPLLYPDWALPLMFAALTVYFAAGNLIAPQWASLMGDLVPERRRGRYFGSRSRSASIAGFVGLATAGLLLNHFADTPFAATGFILVFGIAATARMISTFHLTFLFEPKTGQPEEGEPQSEPVPFARRVALRYSLFISLMQFSVGISAPFFTVYMLRHLELSYFSYMVLIAAVALSQFLTLSMWGRVADAFGNRAVLTITGFMIPALPALWLFGSGFFYLLAVQLLTGAVWAGFNLASGNFLYDLVPAARRANWMAGHNVAGFVGLFLGALLGGWVHSWIAPDVTILGVDFYFGSAMLLVFLFSALIRLLVAVLFLPRIAEVRPARPMTLRRLLFRMTGSRRVLSFFRRRPPTAAPEPVLQEASR